MSLALTLLPCTRRLRWSEARRLVVRVRDGSPRPYVLTGASGAKMVWRERKATSAPGAVSAQQLAALAATSARLQPEFRPLYVLDSDSEQAIDRFGVVVDNALAKLEK